MKALKLVQESNWGLKICKKTLLVFLESGCGGLGLKK